MEMKLLFSGHVVTFRAIAFPADITFLRMRLKGKINSNTFPEANLLPRFWHFGFIGESWRKRCLTKWLRVKAAPVCNTDFIF